jgi:hypothetical protein
MSAVRNVAPVFSDYAVSVLRDPKLYGGELSVLIVCVSPGAQLLDAAEHAAFAAEVTAALPPGSGVLASAPDAVADLTERVGDAPPYCLIPLPLYAAEDSDTSVWRYDRQTRESVSEAVEGRLVSHALHGDAEPDVAAHFFGAGAPRPASAASLALADRLVYTVPLASLPVEKALLWRAGLGQLGVLLRKPGRISGDAVMLAHGRLTFGRWQRLDNDSCPLCEHVDLRLMHKQPAHTSSTRSSRRTPGARLLVGLRPVQTRGVKAASLRSSESRASPVTKNLSAFS